MITSLLLALALAVIPVSKAPRYDIVPTPKSLTPAEGLFTLSKSSALVVEDEAFAEVAADFRSQVAASTGFKLDGKGPKIVLSKVSGLGKEAYKLSVRPTEVVIGASEVNGAFYGLQTLLQLFPAEIYADKLQKKVKWTAPCCIIEDEPEFA
ncbi:MAG: glycoside hydrolase family 20 zincin-like fold domain-containing protein, partial [Bacteroidales bacterium]|nr:glycoside hydrolase family 20 zincin-like fold domain-containing protein [Bacteroidales bacterium]